MFLFIYTNQYTSEKLPRSIQLLFQLSIKYGIDSLTLLCLQDMCNLQNININTAANLLIAVHQAMNDPYEKYHSNDYLIQIKNFKQTILRFIHLHSREVLLSSQWKLLEKQYPVLIHDVLEFMVFEKIDE
jgi:pantothenate kinase-related protein Tda10